MTTYTPPAHLPAPELFEASVLAGCLLQPRVPYGYFTEDIVAIGNAVKRLKEDFRIEIEWHRGKGNPLQLKSPEGETWAETRQHLFSTLIRKQPDWLRQACQGMRTNMHRLCEVATKAYAAAKQSGRLAEFLESGKLSNIASAHRLNGGSGRSAGCAKSIYSLSHQLAAPAIAPIDDAQCNDLAGNANNTNL